MLYFNVNFVLGVFVLNLVCRDSRLYNEVLEKISKVFVKLYTLKIKDEVNEIIYGINRTMPEEEMNVIEAKCSALNEVVTAKTGTKDLISVSDMIKVLKIC